MIVLKFGGTSVGSLERVREAAAIAAASLLPAQSSFPPPPG